MKTNQLYDLAHDGNTQAISAWLTREPDALNQTFEDGMTLLHVACLLGHEGLTNELINRGALVNMNVANSSRATPLHLAVGYPAEEVAANLAKVLIQNGAELNASQEGGQTPLHRAVSMGSIAVVEVLIEGGADPFLKDQMGRSSIDLARELSSEKHREEVQNALKRALSIPSI